MNKDHELKKTVAAASLILYACMILFLFFCVGRPLIRFAGEPAQFREWVRNRGVWGGVAYVGMVLLQVIVAIIPGEPLEIAGGYAFGAAQGTILCMLGAWLGSILVFALVRRFGVRLVECFFPVEKIRSLKFLRDEKKRDGLIFLLMLIPGTPKDLLCYFAGLTEIGWGRWLLIASVGRIPSIVTSTIGGDALGAKRIGFAVVTFAGTLLIGLAGWFFFQALSRRKRESSPQKPCDRNRGG